MSDVGSVEGLRCVAARLCRVLLPRPVCLYRSCQFQLEWTSVVKHISQISLDKSSYL